MCSDSLKTTDIDIKYREEEGRWKLYESSIDSYNEQFDS